jgi:hypothetical protein
MGEIDRKLARAALTAAFSIREGYVLVPKEPTEAMRKAGAEADDRISAALGISAYPRMRSVWHAMLSAAPSTGEET